MNPDSRKRHVVSFENMSEELAAVFNEKYPKGFSDYLPDLVKYTKPDGTPLTMEEMVNKALSQEIFAFVK